MFIIPTLILILNISIFVVSVPLLLIVWRYRNRPEVQWLITLVVAFSIISFCGLNVYIQDSFETKALFYRLRFLGFAILGQAWFFFLALTYTELKFIKSKAFLVASLLPSVITISCVLIPEANAYLIKSYTELNWQGANLLKFSTGSWFKYHITVANIFAISALVITFITFLKSRGVKKNQLAILFGSGFLSLIIDVYLISTNSPLRWALLSGGTFLITEAAILYAILRQGLLDLAPIAKNLIFQAGPEPIIILDAKDRVLDFNTAAKIAFHFSEKDVGQSWKKITMFESISTTERTRNWEFLCADGSLRNFQIEAVKLSASESQEGSIIYFKDITIQKNIEERLKNDNEFKSHLLSLIAHDFSSILQTQSVLSSKIENEVPSHLKGQISTLTSASQNSQELLENILRWAQEQINEESSSATKHRPFEVLTLVRDCIENLHASLDLKRISVDLTCDSPSVILSGDSVMIETVIRNLLTNAIKASSPHQKIEVAIKVDTSEIEIKIIDFGIGIEPTKLTELNQLHIHKSPKLEKSIDGFGVGLLICQKIVANHNGKLQLFSQPQRGTTAILQLPR